LLDSGCCSPTDGSANSELHQRLVAMLQKYNINDFAASVRIYAVKPE
jgi:arsenite methyltransferase